MGSGRAAVWAGGWWPGFWRAGQARLSGRWDTWQAREAHASVHPMGVCPAAVCSACPELEENRPSQPPLVRTQLWGRGQTCQPGPLVCVMPRVRSALALALIVGVGRWGAWTRSGSGSALDSVLHPASGGWEAELLLPLLHCLHSTHFIHSFIPSLIL